MCGFRSAWLPIRRIAAATYLLSFGRLRDGMTLDAARTRPGRSRGADVARARRSTSTRFTARPLHEVITENATRGLWMLLAATSLLLLIACTNVANLLLARAVVRERDLAIRASLGAGRRRLFGQVMGETIALGVLGSVVGIGLAWGLLRIFVSLAPANFPRLAAITLDTGVLGFSLVVAVVAGLIAGLAPAIHLLRSDLNARDPIRRQPRRHRRPRAIGEPAARDLGSGAGAGARDDGGSDGEEPAAAAGAGSRGHARADADVRRRRAAVRAPTATRRCRRFQLGVPRAACARCPA